jgi:hypothetical protein
MKWQQRRQRRSTYAEPLVDKAAVDFLVSAYNENV